jgi:hypothetical protein
MSGIPIVLLSGGDLRRLLRPETAIAALRETHAALADNRSDQGRSVGFTEGGSIHIKSGLLLGSHRVSLAQNQIRTYSWWRPPRMGFGTIPPTA